MLLAGCPKMSTSAQQSGTARNSTRQNIARLRRNQIEVTNRERIVQVFYSPPFGFAQQIGNGSQKAQGPTQKAQRIVTRPLFLCFLCSVFCLLCTFPDPLCKAERRGIARHLKICPRNQKSAE